MLRGWFKKADPRAKIKDYVSNTYSNIYAIQNIPEEIVAVIFAYVSRSPKSFRDNLLKVTQEKAKKFHEKWVLEYGHASVAEHVCLHLGIEKVSRIFTSELQLSNRFLSFTEYSQRYQQPNNCDFYIPKKGIEFDNFYQKIYDIYIELLKHIPFESARYVLPLGTYSSLGMTCNARALSEALSVLKNSNYKETTTNVKKIASEASNIAPTLIKIRKSEKTLNYSNSLELLTPDSSYTVVDTLLGRTFAFQIDISEVCFHQLLRHRGFKLMYSYPSPYKDISELYYKLKQMIPELSTLDSVKKKKIVGLFLKATEISERAYHTFGAHKDYCILNLHTRNVRILTHEDDLEHFVELRTRTNAQYEIRNLAKSLEKKL